MTKFVMVVRTVVNKTETRVVEHLLDAEIKRNLKGFLFGKPVHGRNFRIIRSSI